MERRLNEHQGNVANLGRGSNNINNNNKGGINGGRGGGVSGWRRPALEFANIDLVQEIDEGQGPIRAAAFSRCGQLLATGGADAHVRLYCSQKAWRHFAGLRSARAVSEEVMTSLNPASLAYSPDYASLLLFAVFEGHDDEVVDLSWSTHNFLASVSLDRTVRLWHVSQVDCLQVLRHKDYLSTVRFLPADDRYLVTCTLDGLVRLWSVPKKAVRFKKNVAFDRDNRPSLYGKNLITAACFTRRGSILVLGTADGRLLFYFTDRLQYITQQHVCKRGNPRVIAIESVSITITSTGASSSTEGQQRNSEKLLVTTDDSQVRLFTRHFWTLSEEVLELKGATLKGQAGVAIRASMSPDGAFVVCGSEEAHCFYIWRIASKNGSRQSGSTSKLTLGANLWERLHRRGCERIRLNVATESCSVEQQQNQQDSSSSANNASFTNLVSYHKSDPAVEESLESALLNIDLFADFDDSLGPVEAVIEADEAFEHLEMQILSPEGSAALLAADSPPLGDQEKAELNSPPPAAASPIDLSTTSAAFPPPPPLSPTIVTPTTFAFFAPDPTVFHSLVKYVLISIDHTGCIRVFTKPHYAA